MLHLQCCKGPCSLLAPLPMGYCQHRLANPKKALSIFRHSLSPCKKQDLTHPDSSPPPKYVTSFFPHKAGYSLTYCWRGQRVQSEGTKASLGRTGQGCCCLSADHHGWGHHIASTSFIGCHSAAPHTEFCAT